MTGNIRFEALKSAWKHEPVKVDRPLARANVIFAQNVFTREKMKEYIASNAGPDSRMYKMHQYAYLPDGNGLHIGSTLSLTVASIDDEMMVCYGEVFSRTWAPDAFLGKYVFRRVDDEAVAMWDAAYTTPQE